jgi:hypothetical protein
MPVTTKQAITELWARQLTAKQIAEALGVTSAYVRIVLALMGVSCRRFDTTETAILWLNANEPALARSIEQLRNATTKPQEGLETA